MKLSGIMQEKGWHAFDAEDSVDSNSGRTSPRVWVIVLDTKGAGIWRNIASGFEEIGEIEFCAALCHREEKYGEMTENASVTAFADWLATARDEDMFDRIVLVAEKQMLRLFRMHMPTDILACIAAEIPKDLTNLSKQDKESVLQNSIVA